MTRSARSRGWRSAGKIALLIAGVLGILGGVYACASPPGISSARVAWDATPLGYSAEIGGETPQIIRINGYAAGPNDGRAVILVHGTPGSAKVWKDFIQYAEDQPRAKNLRFITIDRPGFGESEPKGAMVSLKDQAAALAPLLVAENGQKPIMKPIILGHSLGGPVAARAGLDYPDAVGGLVLAAGAFDPDLEKVYAIQYLGDSFLLSWALPRALKNANRELIALKAELKELALGLPQLTTPTIMVHGTDDDLVPYDNVAFLRRMIDPALPFKLMRIDEGDHFLPWNAKETLLEAILDLDQQLRASDPLPAL
ncbi:hypothetical protein JCM17846_16570 [Iodidimonas nitroreducens]|uniref:AB hydrolase-1 domain-containing protein n=1 Tax=Iodidimonas nitroreducens TaxID=1236968 RepID=A0A5A7N8M3_9PROT|nr:alpha/beta hydrolase [Iodidimonas nitroreducens]GAK33730.1 2-hydroxy-6-oxononadienedioate/2-hydroxy-6-oxononatrienedioate hydrolase [alpha proteobacterium Q-1]GER03975.1 hypothetical protein JCM17846_16570 [Iodidimonas nitroreducens]